jgi:hypothetical protein
LFQVSIHQSPCSSMYLRLTALKSSLCYTLLGEYEIHQQMHRQRRLPLSGARVSKCRLNQPVFHFYCPFAMLHVVLTFSGTVYFQVSLFPMRYCSFRIGSASFYSAMLWCCERCYTVDHTEFSESRFSSPSGG